MSERGVFAMDRGWFGHPSFAAEPFTEREAWAWLISQAAFKAHQRRIGKTTILLARGQLANSLRYMASAWQWSEARVRRFLARLKTDAMIDVKADAGITVITVCNYGKYQTVSIPNDAQIDAKADAAATQQRRKVEEKESKEEDDERRRAREPSSENVSRETLPHDLADRVRVELSVDQDDPMWCGLALRLSMGIAAGWHPEHDIIVGVRKSMATLGKAPRTFSYCEKVIADVHAERQRAVPIGTTSNSNQRQRHDEPDRSVLTAVRSLRAKIDAKPDSAPDRNPVLSLPTG